MMLHRSASSRRRRAPRGATSSSLPTVASSAAARGRRASVATDKPIIVTQTNPNTNMERQRSPRGSMVPDINLDSDNDSLDEGTCRRLLPDPEQYNTSRGLGGDLNRSSRNSLIPDDYCRSPRGSIAPDPSRSPRNSLIPDSGRSPRNSLVPEVSRSPRHSLIPDSSLSPRNSLIPDVGYNNRSPRNSLAPTSGSRISLVPENGILAPTQAGGNRSPRHSLIPDNSRSPRGSVANLEFDRSSRGSICPAEMSRTSRDVIDRSPRGSITSEYAVQQSPRGSIVPDSNRSPRGSICPESSSRSPRGSIAPNHDPNNRSPRGSIGVNEVDKHSRGSLGGLNEDDNRSPRGSIGPDIIDRSPRGSLGGGQDRRTPKPGLTFQEPRRASADQGITRNRSTSPYHQRETNSGSVRSAGAGAQVNLGYGTNAWAESRRASSSVSQFSGDESRRLCAGGPYLPEKSSTTPNNLGVATYGSLVFQLKDAHLEASGTCDFVFRALRVVSKTMVVTICLACLTTMPILMFILGLQYIKDCPIQPHIPVYMVVGGTLGAVRMFWALYSQIRSRRPEVLSVPHTRPHVSPMKLISVVLSCFLAIWFAVGNYWIMSIKSPNYSRTLFEPNAWCDKTLYMFSLVHLCIVYAVLAAIVMVAFGLAFCRILACPWPERYK